MSARALAVDHRRLFAVDCRLFAVACRLFAVFVGARGRRVSAGQFAGQLAEMAGAVLLPEAELAGQVGGDLVGHVAGRRAAGGRLTAGRLSIVDVGLLVRVATRRIPSSVVGRQLSHSEQTFECFKLD